MRADRAAVGSSARADGCPRRAGRPGSHAGSLAADSAGSRAATDPRPAHTATGSGPDGSRSGHAGRGERPAHVDRRLRSARVGGQAAARCRQAPSCLPPASPPPGGSADRCEPAPASAAFGDAPQGIRRAHPNGLDNPPRRQGAPARGDRVAPSCDGRRLVPTCDARGVGTRLLPTPCCMRRWVALSRSSARRLPAHVPR